MRRYVAMAALSAQLSPRTSLTTSAVSRDTFPVRAATAAVECCCASDTVPCVERPRCPLRSAQYPPCIIRSGDIYQTSLPSQRTMMTRANSPNGEAGRLFILPVTATLDHVRGRHSRILVSPHCRP
jgi:hypothetical protein